MKVLVLKNNLKAGLHTIERIANKNINLPILENVLVSTEKNFLILTATDLETAIKCWILAKIEDKGNIAVPAKFLSVFINSLDLEKILLKSEGNFLFIENKNFQTKIKINNSDDFPPLPQFDETNALQINTAPFIEGLKQVVETASLSQTNPAIGGILFDVHPEFIKLVATDSFRLAEKTLYFEKEEKKEIPFIVPLKTARELINVFADKKGKFVVYFTKNYVVFDFSGDELSQPRVQIFSRLIEGEYPNYQDIIPHGFETQATLSKTTFLNQIKTAGLFCSKVNEVKMKMNPKKKEIEIFSQSPDLGENKSSFQGEIKGKETEVSFNWRFLSEGLSNIKSQEVIFELNGGEGPSVLRPVGDASYFYILMPIKSL